MTNYNAQAWNFLKGAWNVTAAIVQMADAAATKAEINRLAEEAAKPPEPAEGFASIEELEQYRYQPGSFYFGQIDEAHGVNFEAGIDDDRHLFIQAGSRSGKGTSFIVQNAIRWPGPLLMIDPKGEAASITAMRRGTREEAMGTGTSVRHFLEQNVAIIDPFGETKGPARIYKTNYNPFIDIDMEVGGGVRQIRAIASSIVLPEQGNSAHFSETAETVIAGLIEAMMVQEEHRDKNFGNGRDVRNLLETCVSNLALRTQEDTKPSKKTLSTITAADIPAPDSLKSNSTMMKLWTIIQDPNANPGERENAIKQLNKENEKAGWKRLTDRGQKRKRSA